MQFFEMVVNYLELISIIQSIWFSSIVAAVFLEV